MADHAQRPIDTQEQQRADAMWHRFINAAKFTIIFVASILILMALFLL